MTISEAGLLSLRLGLAGRTDNEIITPYPCNGGPNGPHWCGRPATYVASQGTGDHPFQWFCCVMHTEGCGELPETQLFRFDQWRRHVDASIREEEERRLVQVLFEEDVARVRAVGKIT